VDEDLSRIEKTTNISHIGKEKQKTKTKKSPPLTRSWWINNNDVRIWQIKQFQGIVGFFSI